MGFCSSRCALGGPEQPCLAARTTSSPAAFQPLPQQLPGCTGSPPTPTPPASLQESVETLTLRDGKLSVRSGDAEYQTLVNSVPTQSLTYYKLSFDLSWLSTRAVIRSARVLFFMSKPLPSTAAYTGGGVKLEVWDASRPLKSFCSASCPTGTNGKTCFLCPPNKAALPDSVPCAQPGCAGTRVSFMR